MVEHAESPDKRRRNKKPQRSSSPEKPTSSSRKSSNKTKTLLKVNPVNPRHWSSGVRKGEVHQTRCVIQIVKAANLLASDAETGKSDPVCFLKFCSEGEVPKWDDFASSDSGILSTAVIKACTDPIWNSYHTFPLILDHYNDLLNATIHLLIRDEDINEDGSRSYDDLGQVQIPVREAIKAAKVVQRESRNAFVGSPQWYEVEKCPGMRKKDGKILLSVSIHFEDSDSKLQSIQEEVGLESIAELMNRYKLESTGTVDLSANAGTSPRRNQNAALTPQVASPVRLRSKTTPTPALELKKPVKNSLPLQPPCASELATDDMNNEILDAEKESCNVGSDRDDVVETPEQNEISKKEPLNDIKITDNEYKLALSEAIRNAKLEAELEASESIKKARTEAAVAKECAKFQINISEAVNRTARKMESAMKSQGVKAEKTALSVDLPNDDWHEGDLYWDENDNIGGGNNLGKRKNDQEMLKGQAYTDSASAGHTPAVDKINEVDERDSSLESKEVLMTKRTANKAKSTQNQVPTPDNARLKAIETKVPKHQERNEIRNNIQENKEGTEQEQNYDTSKAGNMTVPTGGDESIPPQDTQENQTGRDDKIPKAKKERRDSQLPESTSYEEKKAPLGKEKNKMKPSRSQDSDPLPPNNAAVKNRRKNTQQPESNNDNIKKENIANSANNDEAESLGNRSRIPRPSKNKTKDTNEQSESKVSDSENRVKEKTNKKKSDESRRQAEARQRIRQAKEQFQQKQANNAIENPDNGLMFVPTGGDESLPPQVTHDMERRVNRPAVDVESDMMFEPYGGDESIPPQDDHQFQKHSKQASNNVHKRDGQHPSSNSSRNKTRSDNASGRLLRGVRVASQHHSSPQSDDTDDDSVATTTVDEEEYSPRRVKSSFPGQGNHPDTIYALREISRQREQMNSALEELKRSSEHKFSLVEKQLSRIRGEGTDANADNLRGLQTRMSSYSNSHLSLLRSSEGDTVEDMVNILQNGDADDIGIMLDKVPPRYNEEMSLAYRAQLYEFVSLLLRRGKHKDSCLEWIAALLNTHSGRNLVQGLPEHICQGIVNALVIVSSEPNSRGVTAARLERHFLDQCYN